MCRLPLCRETLSKPTRRNASVTVKSVEIPFPVLVAGLWSSTAELRHRPIHRHRATAPEPRWVGPRRASASAQHEFTMHGHDLPRGSGSKRARQAPSGRSCCLGGRQNHSESSGEGASRRNRVFPSEILTQRSRQSQDEENRSHCSPQTEAAAEQSS